MNYELKSQKTMQQSKNKWINKALTTLGIEWNCSEYDCNSISSIKLFISNQMRLKQEQLNLIETANENLEIITRNIDIANEIINQAEIEEILANNPKAHSAYIIN